jgi:hypothetical protein
MVVNMNIVARINFSSKLKVSTSVIGYYSYTNRYPQAKNQPHILALSFFANTQIQR